MEITKTKPMYVGVDEVCADWGVSRSNDKTFDVIRNEMKAIDEHLMSLKSVDELELEKLESLRMILEILDGFYKNSDS